MPTENITWYVDGNQVSGDGDGTLTHQFSDPGVHTVKVEAENCCGICFQEYEVLVLPPITIERVDCCRYKLCDSRIYEETSYTLKIKIYDVKGEVISEKTYPNYKGKQGDFEITVPQSGIYTVEFIIDGTVIESFVLFEFCKLIECYRRLVIDVLCSAEDCCEFEYLQKELYKLNAFMLGAMNFLGMLLIYGDYTWGYMYVADVYANLLKDIDWTLKKLESICYKCTSK